MNEGAVDLLVKLSWPIINADFKGQLKATLNSKTTSCCGFRAGYGGRFRIPG